MSGKDKREDLTEVKEAPAKGPNSPPGGGGGGGSGSVSGSSSGGSSGPIGLKKRSGGRTAPPTVSPFRLDLNPDAFYSKNSLDPNPQSVLLFSINYCYLNLKTNMVFPDEIPEQKCATWNLDEEQKDWLASVNSKKDCWIEYVYDLLCCFKVKPMTSANIGNYFAALKSSFRPSDQVPRFLTWVAAEIPALDIKTVRNDMMSFNPFIDYHTRASSSASLIKHFAENFPKVMDQIFPDIDMKVVDEIDKNCYDLSQSYRLPGVLLGIVSIWVTHEGVIRAPNRWYQGERARAALSTRERNLWEAFFRSADKGGLPDFQPGDGVVGLLVKVVESGADKKGVKIQ